MRSLAVLLLLCLSSPALAHLRLSEVLLRNERGPTLGIRGRVPWLELHNPGAAPQPLKGYHLLLRSPRHLRDYPLPDAIIPAHGHLVLYASGHGGKDGAGRRHLAFGLPPGLQALAIKDPAGRIVDRLAPIPWTPPDVAWGRLPDGAPRILSIPTPGQPNESKEENRGPEILQAEADPRLQVRAKIRSRNAPLRRVLLEWQVDLGEVSRSPMRCEGSGQDLVCQARIPARTRNPGSFLRWRVLAEDQTGGRGRWPLYVGHRDAPRWDGVAPRRDGTLPSLDLLCPVPRNAMRGRKTRCSLGFRGQFQDQIFLRKRGGRSWGWPKPNLKIELPAGAELEILPGVRVDEFNLSSNWSDKSSLRRELAWETYRRAGVVDAFCFPVEIRLNGDFFALSHACQHFDKRFLRRNRLDPKGALYKVYSDCCSPAMGVKKKTRKDEGDEELRQFISGLLQRRKDRTAQEAFLFQRVDLPATLNYLAATALMHDNDHVAKNYFLYRDSRASKRWRMLPWDKDLTFGRNFLDGPGVLNDAIWAAHDPQSHPLFGDKQHPKVKGLVNCLIDALYRSPRIRQMYLRRLRSLMDKLLQPPGTPRAALLYEDLIHKILKRMDKTLASDATRWVRDWGKPLTADQDAERLIRLYLEPRRKHLYETHGPKGSGLIPPAQAARPPIRLEACPEARLCLFNPGEQAVDLSGWRIRGAWQMTLAPGTVLAAGDRLHLEHHWSDLPREPGKAWYLAGLQRGEAGSPIRLLNEKAEERARLGEP